MIVYSNLHAQKWVYGTISKIKKGMGQERRKRERGETRDIVIVGAIVAASIPPFFLFFLVSMYQLESCGRRS